MSQNIRPKISRSYNFFTDAAVQSVLFVLGFKNGA